MRPVGIKQISKDELMLEWNDGHKGPVGLRELRDSCPCAECAGETVLFRSYVPPEADKGSPGRYLLAKAETVGGYGLKLTWKDGHDLGIYTWEQMRDLCGCAACGEKRIRCPG